MPGNVRKRNSTDAFSPFCYNISKLQDLRKRYNRHKMYISFIYVDSLKIFLITINIWELALETQAGTNVKCALRLSGF